MRGFASSITESPAENDGDLRGSDDIQKENAIGRRLQTDRHRHAANLRKSLEIELGDILSTRRGGYGEPEREQPRCHRDCHDRGNQDYENGPRHRDHHSLPGH